MKFLFLSIIFFVNPAFAYIPNSEYILDRTSSNHGSGIYVVHQTLTIYSPDKLPVELKEKWTIDSAKKMRLEVSQKREGSDDVRFTFLYLNNKRLTVDQKGLLRASSISEDFVEPLFYYKSVTYVKELLSKMGIIPKNYSPPKASKNEYTPEPFVRLSRTLGVINYAFGEISSDPQNRKPGLWIEQDLFHVRKLRLPDGTEVIANKYQRHSHGFWVPYNRQVRWGEQRANANITSVKYYPNGSAIKKDLWESSINPKAHPNLIANFSDDETVMGFYKRFR